METPGIFLLGLESYDIVSAEQLRIQWGKFRSNASDLVDASEQIMWKILWFGHFVTTCVSLRCRTQIKYSSDDIPQSRLHVLPPSPMHRDYAPKIRKDTLRLPKQSSSNIPNVFFLHLIVNPIIRVNADEIESGYHPV